MKIVHVSLLALLLSAALAPAPVLAHHSFAAEFDRKKPVTLKGTVTRLDWQNPHTRLYLDVVDGAGKVINWEFELSSPNSLMLAGWTRKSVQAGDKITIEGFLAKDGARLANANRITAADGKQILSEQTVAK